MSASLVKLLDTLYASVLESPPWVSFLEALEEELSAHYGTMVIRKPRQGDAGALVSTQGNSAALVALQDRLFSESPFLELPEGEICILGEMMSEAQLRALHPDYYRYLRDYGDAADLIGVDLVDPETDMTFRLRAARLSSEPRFGAGERKLLAELVPRLHTAAALYARLARQRYEISVSKDAVERLAVGSLLLDEHGRVLMKNPFAARVLEHGDGLVVRDGTLHCVGADDDESLQRLLKGVRAALGARGRTSLEDSSLRVGRDGGRRWSLLLRPARARPGLGEKIAGTVQVLLRDAEQLPKVSKSLLIELFGLTPAEASLAERLVRGESINDAAAALGRSRNTARAQLASIFAKTDTHRQPHLVSHILATVNSIWT